MEAGGRARLVTALAGTIVQPLDQRLRRAHQFQRRIVEAGEIRRLEQRREWVVGLSRAAECRPRDDFLRQKFVGDFVDAEIDRRNIGADIVGEPFLQRGVVRKPCRIWRILQRLLADGGAIDAEDPHQVGRLPAEFGLLARGKAHHLGVEFELFKSQFLRRQRPAGQPAGIDVFVDLRCPAPGNADAAAIGIRRHAVDGVEVERQPRRQNLALLAETVGQAIDETHLAAALVALQGGEVAPVEPVDDADQAEACGLRLQPAHVHDAADIAVGHFV